jgi:hypothetical protein
MQDDEATLLINSLGITITPAEPPWEAAYEAWARTPQSLPLEYKDAWKAAVQWCVKQIDNANDPLGGVALRAAYSDILRCIMGQEQQL